MSTLDEAFIKAYRKRIPRTAGQPATAPEPAPAQGTSAQAVLHDREPVAVPTPHSFEKPVEADERAAPGEPAAATSGIKHDALRPAFEVPHFLWPTLVSELISHASGDFARLSAWLAAVVERSPKIIMTSGLSRGEGRTTVTLALALSAAQRGLRIALVDLDFLKPSLAESLGIVAQSGGEEVFTGELSLADAMVESLTEPICVLPLARPLSDHDRVTAKRRVSESLQVLRRHFDLVLVDSSPMDTDAAAIDAAAILAGSGIHDAVVVRDVNRVAPEEIRLVGRRLAAAGIARWNVIENFVPSALQSSAVPSAGRSARAG